MKRVPCPENSSMRTPSASPLGDAVPSYDQWVTQAFGLDDGAAVGPLAFGEGVVVGGGTTARRLGLGLGVGVGRRNSAAAATRPPTIRRAPSTAATRSTVRSGRRATRTTGGPVRTISAAGESFQRGCGPTAGSRYACSAPATRASRRSSTATSGLLRGRREAPDGCGRLAQIAPQPLQ